jgi:hypothetical protein
VKKLLSLSMVTSLVLLSLSLMGCPERAMAPKESKPAETTAPAPAPAPAPEQTPAAQPAK